MHQCLNMGESLGTPLRLSHKGKVHTSPKNRAESAKAIPGEVFKRHEARSKEVNVANGEAILAQAENITRHADSA